MSDERWMAELTTQVRLVATAVEPTTDAPATVHARLERLRRRRAVATVVGSAALVVLLGLGIPVLLPARSGPDGSPTPAPPATSPTAGASSFTCPQGLDFLTDPPPIPDRVDQQRVVDQLAGIDSVRVRHAEPTALGVVALVQDDSGDLDFWADPEVADRLSRLGVARVYEWDPTASGSGVDAAAQVRQVLGWELDPVMRDVRRAVRGVPGSAGFAFWPEAGAIVVQWKAPLLPEVRALAGTRPGGVRVEVRSTVYSDADMRRAQRRLQDWLQDTGRRDQWSSAVGCADGSGLVIGMLPRVAAESGLAKEIANAVGMPVLVVPETRPIPLDGRAPGG